MAPPSPARPSCRPSRRRGFLRLLRRGLAALVALLAIFYWLWTGPRNLSRYPPASKSPYKLPWPEGIEHRCIQGNNAVVSHRGRDEFAYDFAMPVGSDVCAARGGKVTRVVDEHNARGSDAPNNLIVIEHEDATLGSYLHLQRGGAAVKPGDRVKQGQRIAASGNVGRSLAPHLHFHVTDENRNFVPVTFADESAARHQGIPRMFFTYTADVE